MLIASGADAAGSGAAAIFIVLAFVLGAAFYFLPTIIAIIRKVPNLGSVIVINVFLGWTLVGWVVSLAMAARSVPQPTQVNVYPPQPGYPPQQGYPQQPGQPPYQP